MQWSVARTYLMKTSPILYVTRTGQFLKKQILHQMPFRLHIYCNRLHINTHDTTANV